MIRKLIIVFGILAVIAAFAGSVPTGGTYTITLREPSVVKGMDFKPGEYKITVGADKVTFRQGKDTKDVPVKIESVPDKFSTTAIRFTQDNGKNSVVEIRLGGTTTKLVFN